MNGLIVTFYYQGRAMFDPDWSGRPSVIPDVGDEVFLKNIYEDPYEKFWYVVSKRRWLNDRIVRIYLDDNRWQATN